MGQGQGQGQDQGQGQGQDHEKVRQRSALLQLQMVLALTLTLVLTLELVQDSASQPSYMVMVGGFLYLMISYIFLYFSISQENLSGTEYLGRPDN